MQNIPNLVKGLSANEQLPSYIPETQQVFFGLLLREKCQRQRPGNTGAAGTKTRYWGRWTSFGGTKNVPTATDLSQAYEELRDEGNLSADIEQHLRLEFAAKVAQGKGCTSVFIFYMPKFDQFFNLFPKYPSMRAEADIVKSSKGEIDAVCSMDMNTIKSQSQKIAGYVVDTIVSILIPEMSQRSKAFKNKYGQLSTLPRGDGARHPEHAWHRYWEMCRGPVNDKGSCAYSDVYYTQDWPTLYVRNLASLIA